MNAYQWIKRAGLLGTLLTLSTISNADTIKCHGRSVAGDAIAADFTSKMVNSLPVRQLRIMAPGEKYGSPAYYTTDLVAASSLQLNRNATLPAWSGQAVEVRGVRIYLEKLERDQVDSLQRGPRRVAYIGQGTSFLGTVNCR